MKPQLRTKVQSTNLYAQYKGHVTHFQSPQKNNIRYIYIEKVPKVYPTNIEKIMVEKSRKIAESNQ